MVSVNSADRCSHTTFTSYRWISYKYSSCPQRYRGSEASLSTNDAVCVIWCFPLNTVRVCVFEYALVKSRCYERPCQSWVRIRDLLCVYMWERETVFLTQRAKEWICFLNDISLLNHFNTCGLISELKFSVHFSHWRFASKVGSDRFRFEESWW